MPRREPTYTPLTPNEVDFLLTNERVESCDAREDGRSLTLTLDGGRTLRVTVREGALDYAEVVP
jgi:hypothetical protein